MTVVFMADPASGKVALFDEAPGGGDPADPASLRNRPLLDPSAWLANLYFHSGLDNLEVAVDQTITVNHAVVAATGTIGALGGDVASSVKLGASSTDLVLLNHGQAAVADAMVVAGNRVLYPGMPLQTFSDGRGRYVSAYVTGTQVKLHEWTSVSATALPAVSIDYRVLVFRAPPAPSGSLLADFDPASGALGLARGRFLSSRRYLQVVPGGSPFSVAYGKSIDLKNGAPRFTFADGSVFDPVPANQKGRLSTVFGSHSFTGAYGNSMAYNGSFAAPPQILVQAP